MTGAVSRTVPSLGPLVRCIPPGAWDIGSTHSDDRANNATRNQRTTGGSTNTRSRAPVIREY